jgi:RHS repeat-associated protein
MKTPNRKGNKMNPSSENDELNSTASNSGTGPTGSSESHETRDAPHMSNTDLATSGAGANVLNAVGAANNTVQGPASVTELARALRKNPDLIFYHVYNQIEYSPSWGAMKGALGTLLDGVGNSFDQCQLLVELLTQAGYSAQYVIGEIDLSNAQLSAWLGTDSSSINAAVVLLDQAGIPHQTPYVSGGVDRMQLTHVWVKVTLGGTDYVLDPSIKSYTNIPSRIDLATATQYNESDFLGATSGLKNGATIDPVNGDWIQRANYKALRDKLTTYSMNLVNYIKNFNKLWYATIGGAVTIGDVVTLTCYNIGLTAGKRSVSYTTVSGDTPTSIATALKNAINADTNFSANSITAASSGSKITITTNSANTTSFTSDLNVGATETIDVSNPQATIDEVLGGRKINQISSPWRITSLSYQVGSPSSFSSIPTNKRIAVNITASSVGITKGPYYADEVYAKRFTVFFNSSRQPVLRLDGVTEATGSVVGFQQSVNFSVSISHPNSAFNETVSLVTVSPYSPIGTGYKHSLLGLHFGECGKGMVDYYRRIVEERIAAGDAPDSESLLGAQLAVTWRTYHAEFSQMADLIGRMTNSRRVLRHYSGTVQKDTQYNYSFIDFKPTAPANTSVVSMDNNLANATKFSIVYSFWGHSLETTAHQQVSGNFKGGGAHTTLRLGNVSAAATISGTVTAGNTATLTFTDSALSTSPRSVVYTVQAGDTLSTITTALKNLVNADSVLSPLVAAQVSPTSSTVVVLTSNSRNMTSFTASSVGSVSIAIAPLKLYRGTSANWGSISSQLKDFGSSIGTPGANTVILVPERGRLPSNGLTLDAWAYSTLATGVGGAQGIINGFKGSVDPIDYDMAPQCECRKCELEEADPVVLRTGAYRYRQTDLSIGSSSYPYKLDFGVEYDSQERTVDGPLGFGWRHTWQLAAAEVTRFSRSSGEESPIDAAAAIVALYVVGSLMSDVAQPIEKPLAAWYTNAWWGDEATRNVAIVETPDATNAYVKLPDGSYNPPRGVASTLVKNSTGKFVMTTPQGDKYTYRATDFRLETIEFKFGVTITLTYDGSGKLQAVSNGLGRTLTLNYSGAKLASVTDGTGRSVQYSLSSNLLTAIKDPLLNDTTFQYDSNGRFWKYFLPENPTSPMVTNTYDSLGRIASQLDSARRVIASVESSKVTVGGTVTIGDVLTICVRVPSLKGGQASVSYTVQSGDTLPTIATGLKNAITSSSLLTGIGVVATSAASTVSLSSHASATYELSTSLGASTTLAASATAGDLLTLTVFNASLSGGQKSVGYTVLSGDTTMTISQQLMTAVNSDTSLAAIGVSASPTTGVPSPSFALTSNSANSTTFGYSVSTNGTESITFNSRSFYVAGWRTEFVNPYGSSGIYEFDRDDNLIVESDELGNVTSHAFDALGRRRHKTLPEGNSIQWTYDCLHNALTETHIAKSGSLLQKIERAFVYHPVLNKIVSSRDALDRITSYSYNVDGTLASVTRPAVSAGTPQISMTYNSRGQVLTRKERVDGNSSHDITTKFDYDSLTEKLLAVTEDFGSGRLNLETALSYNARGDISAMQNPKGSSVNLVYDERRRLVQRTAPSPFAYVAKISYDKNDNVVKLERQKGVGWQSIDLSYSSANNVQSITDSLGHVDIKQYDELDRLWKTIDGENRTTEFRYTARGDLNLTLQDNPVDPSTPIATVCSYSPNGLETSVSDNRHNVTKKTFDGHDRLDRTIYSDGSFEQNSYDPNGNVLTKRHRDGNSTVQTFDDLGRLLTRAPFGQATVSFSYDLTGRMIKCSTPFVSGKPSTGDFIFFFDTAGRLIKERYSDGTVQRDVTYELDSNGNLTRLTYPDGYFVDKVYDELDRLTDIKLNGASISSAHLEYDDLSRRTRLSYANGSSVDYGHLANDALFSLVASVGVNPSVYLSYEYNDANQLVKATASDPSNYEWRPALAGVTTYGAANSLNQYPSVAGTGLTYNLNGCLTSDGTWAYGFDSENHLVSANSGGASVTFEYDGRHRQIQKSTSGGAKTIFIYSEWQRIADYDGTTNPPALNTRFVYGSTVDEVLLAVSSTGAVSYYFQDRVGNVIAKSDAAGTTSSSYRYSPTGESSGLIGTTHGFTGQRFDSETGLYYFKNRYYSPKLGRFLQPDSVPDVNLYAYVQNDPVNNTDPFGKNMLGVLYGGAQVLILAALLLILALLDFFDKLKKCPKIDDLDNLTMGSDGTPRGNERQNRQYKEAIRRIERRIGRRLTQAEKEQLHQGISGENMGLEEIVDWGEAEFGNINNDGVPDDVS